MSSSLGIKRLGRIMMRPSLVVLLSMVAVGPAHAAILTFHFEGRVDRVSDPNGVLGGNVTAGDAFSGEYSFDSAASDQLSDDPEHGLFSTVPPFLFTVGPFSWISAATGYIRVSNGPNVDHYSAWSWPFKKNVEP
ncbi:MAG: hypothetical protein HY718_10045 [Planctomycetes bacterium]|nr:hypothetical protein [Planctomycetota bacterium]